MLQHRHGKTGQRPFPTPAFQLFFTCWSNHSSTFIPVIAIQLYSIAQRIQSFMDSLEIQRILRIDPKCQFVWRGSAVVLIFGRILQPRNITIQMICCISCIQITEITIDATSTRHHILNAGCYPFILRNQPRPKTIFVHCFALLFVFNFHFSCRPVGLWTQPEPVEVEPHQTHLFAPGPWRCLRVGEWMQPEP